MIETVLLSVVLGATPSPPPLPPLPPMWPGPVTSPQPQDQLHLDWADPVGRLRDGELIYHPPLLEPWYPSVPETLIDVPPLPGRPQDPLQWADPGHPAAAAGSEGIDGPPDLPPLPAPDAAPFACPTLPAAAGLRWVHERGEDFDLCYAYPRAAPKQPDAPARFGLYHGLHPSFDPASRQPVAQGTIDGRPVRWFQARDGGAYARETLFSPRTRRYGWTLHLWINAANAKELSDTLPIVSQLPLQ
ncbi:MAG: hypothetical protein JF591_14845 [Lysobacter sp.]|nr:hypothetical protein [Lysobacter sp.]